MNLGDGLLQNELVHALDAVYLVNFGAELPFSSDLLSLPAERILTKMSQINDLTGPTLSDHSQTAIQP